MRTDLQEISLIASMFTCPTLRDMYLTDHLSRFEIEAKMLSPIKKSAHQVNICNYNNPLVLLDRALREQTNQSDFYCLLSSCINLAKA